MKKMKKIVSVFCTVLILLSLCACGASSKQYAATEAEAPAAAPALAYATTAGGFAADAAMPAEAYEKSEAEEGGSSADVTPDKIIYSASATVETTDFEATVAGVNALVKENGGFVESSSVNGTNYYNKSRGYSSARSAYFTLRIPSANFSTVMGSLSELGNVPYSHTFTENISARYYDTQARLNAYKTQEESLLRMMEKAETVEDIIAIEDKLSDIRYNIESLQTTLNGWDRQVNFSTIDLEVNEVYEYTPQTVEHPSYWQELMTSLRDGLKRVAEFFKDLLVWLLGALPTLAVLAVLAVLLVPLMKKLRAKRKAKKESKQKGREDI